MYIRPSGVIVPVVKLATSSPCEDARKINFFYAGSADWNPCSVPFSGRGAVHLIGASSPSQETTRVSSKVKLSRSSTASASAGHSPVGILIWWNFPDYCDIRKVLPWKGDYECGWIRS